MEVNGKTFGISVFRKTYIYNNRSLPFWSTSLSDEMAKIFLEAKMKILAIFRINGRVNRKKAILTPYPINVEY